MKFYKELSSTRFFFQTWVWEYQAEEDGEKVDMFMDANEEIRFRVISESFVDTSPNAPEVTKKPPTAGQGDAAIPVSGG